MNPITWLINYTAAAQIAINGLNKNGVVVDDSQLIKYLNELSQDHNCILMGVIPDFSPNGTHPDDYMAAGSFSFFILKKTDFSDHNHEQFIGIFKDTFPLAKDLVEKMLNEAREGCDVIRYLDAGSIHILPVWNKAACNGWQILFDIDFPLWR